MSFHPGPSRLYPKLGCRPCRRFLLVVAKTTLSPEHQRLAALLRSLREEAGLRQEDVAERLGRPQSFVSKYEGAERKLDVIELRQLCSILGLDLRAFVDRFEPDPKKRQK